MVAPQPSLRIRRASLEDLPGIVVIEHASFSAPWPTYALRQEISRTDAIYLVMLVDDAVAGYGGMWMVVDEGHIGTLAVSPDHRGLGLGEALMLGLLATATRQRLDTVFLEYRVSNDPAAALYRKLGFAPIRIRKRYYPDNNEDAVEVVLRDVLSEARQTRFADLRQQWEVRHGRSLPAAP